MALKTVISETMWIEHTSIQWNNEDRVFFQFSSGKNVVQCQYLTVYCRRQKPTLTGFFYLVVLGYRNHNLLYNVLVVRPKVDINQISRQSTSHLSQTLPISSSQIAMLNKVTNQSFASLLQAILLFSCLFNSVMGATITRFVDNSQINC